MSMKIGTVPVCALLLFMAACEDSGPDATPPAVASDTIAFVDVNVIPMDSEQELRGYTVLVTDGQISALGPADEIDVPQDAKRVDGAGKYLMPGLAEMHAHIPGTGDRDYAETVLFLYVANGVTTIRGMAGDRLHLELREQTANGELMGSSVPLRQAPGSFQL